MLRDIAGLLCEIITQRENLVRCGFTMRCENNRAMRPADPQSHCGETSRLLSELT